MNSPVTVSVVIPCYNARQYIAATLESVFAQKDIGLEVILVDDGSRDGSADFVAAQFPQVTVYRTANQGPSAARNFGTGHSSGEFIQYLDADDLLAPGKLQTQLAALRSTNADVAHGDWTKFRTGEDGTKIILGHIVRQLGPEPDLDLFRGFWCPTGAWLTRRTMVDRVGGWLPQFPVIQDARFTLDCALHGARFVYCPGVMAEYRVHQEGSVSTRSRAAFLDDCLRNALEVRDWWASRDQLGSERRTAVIGVLDMVASGSLVHAPKLFRRACDSIDEIPGQYPPKWSLKKRIAVKIFGYRSSVAFAHRLRSYTSGSQRADVS